MLLHAAEHKMAFIAVTKFTSIELNANMTTQIWENRQETRGPFKDVILFLTCHSFITIVLLLVLCIITNYQHNVGHHKVTHWQYESVQLVCRLVCILDMILQAIDLCWPIWTLLKSWNRNPAPRGSNRELQLAFYWRSIKTYHSTLKGGPRKTKQNISTRSQLLKQQK